MTRSIVRACVVAAGVVGAVAARADSAALNVKPGLWEMTVQLSGLPLIPQDKLAGMPPEQRAKVAAMLGAVTQPHTTKTCLTKEKLARGPLELNESNKSCKRTVVANSATTLDLKLECPVEGGALSTSLHVEAPTPEALKGTSVIVHPNRAGTTTSTIQGKWVSADCGGVR